MLTETKHTIQEHQDKTEALTAHTDTDTDTEPRVNNRFVTTRHSARCRVATAVMAKTGMLPSTGGLCSQWALCPKAWMSIG